MLFRGVLVAISFAVLLSGRGYGCERRWDESGQGLLTVIGGILVRYPDFSSTEQTEQEGRE